MQHFQVLLWRQLCFYTLDSHLCYHTFMQKFTLVLLLFLTLLSAKDLQPIATLKASGLVSDIVEDKGLLYVATDAGIVDIIDLVSQKIVSQINFAPIHTTIGDDVPTRVHSVDRYQG